MYKNCNICNFFIIQYIVLTILEIVNKHVKFQK